MSEFGSRPDGIPLHAALWTSSDPLTPVRESIYRLSGYTPNVTAVPAADHNGKFQSAGFWLGYLDCNGIRNNDWLDVSVITQLSTSKLAWAIGENATASPGAAVTSRTTILFEGTRVETDAAFLQNPIDPEAFPFSAEPLFVSTVPKPGRIWVYMPKSDPFGVRVEGVGPVDVDSPLAGEITLRAADIDAGGLITGHTDPITLPLPARELPINIPVLFVDGDFSGDVTIGGTLGVTGVCTLGPTTCTGTVGIGVTGSSITGSAGVFGTSTLGPGVLGQSAGATAVGVSGVSTLNVGVSGTGGGAFAGVEGTGGATGVGVSGIGGSTGAGVSGLGGADGVGVAGTGGGTSGHGVSGVSQSNNSDGVRGTGFNAAASHGVKGVASNTSAFGVFGTTAAAATTSAAGVRAEGLGDAPAVSALAVDGNALIVQTDVTAPKRSPVVIIPVDSDPTTTQVGSLYPNSSRLNKFRTYNGTLVESVHGSPKGSVFGLSTANAGSNVATSGDIADVTITPEEIGIVLVEVTGFWIGSTDTTTMAIVLKDITGVVTISTSPTLVAPDRDGDGEDRTMPFTYRLPYTLPTAATRLFRCRLNFSALVDWADVVMTVSGVF